MNIEINKVYRSVTLGENVTVLHEKLNNIGDLVYAGLTDSGELLWVYPKDLIETRNLLPLQKELLNSEKKRINIIACGVGSGTTTAFFYNVIKEGKDATIVCNSYGRALDYYTKFIKFLQDIEFLGTVRRRVMEVYFSNYKVSFKTNTNGSMGSDIYYNYNITGDSTLIRPEKGNLYFRCLPSDLISGYKTTVANGYYQVKECYNPLLKFVIEQSGKIPEETPTNIKKFLKSNTNLITGYNHTDNKYLHYSFADSVSRLNYSDHLHVLGEWLEL